MKKAFTKLAGAMIAASIFAGTAVPALAAESALEPEMTEQVTDSTTEGEHGAKVSKYDIQPGECYAADEYEFYQGGMVAGYRLISHHVYKIEKVYEDYTWFFSLWSTRRADVIDCQTNKRDTINCDNYTFYELQ